MQQNNNFRSRIRALTESLLCKDIDSSLNTTNVAEFFNQDLYDVNKTIWFGCIFSQMEMVSLAGCHAFVYVSSLTIYSVLVICCLTSVCHTCCIGAFFTLQVYLAIGQFDVSITTAEAGLKLFPSNPASPSPDLADLHEVKASAHLQKQVCSHLIFLHM